MAKGATPQTQTSTYTPNPYTQELLGLAMPNLQAFAANPPKLQEGSQIAGFDPLQTQGQNMVLGTTAGQQGVVGNAATGTNFLTSGDVLRPESNPALQGYIDAAVRPISENLTQLALPAIRSGATQAGQFGSSRHGIAEGLAIGKTNQAIGDTTSKIANTAYGQGLDAMQRGLALAPSTAQALTIPGVTTSGVGDVRQALAQALLGEGNQKYMYEQMLPLLVGRELAQIASGIPGGTTTAQASTPQKNPWSSAAGGALTGASLGSMFGPIGTGVGALGGGLYGFFG